MQYVLHLTEQCNFRCDYCMVPKGDRIMGEETARRVADYAFLQARAKGHRTTCLSFYGGEPLLCRGLIQAIIEYCEKQFGSRGVEFHYRMTTNGALLDEELLRFAREHRMRIALSIDGAKRAHDMHRVDLAGGPTLDFVHAASIMLLDAFPNAPAMMTVNPDTAHLLMESVDYLYSEGFQTFVTTPNFNANWTDKTMDALIHQYRLLAEWYGDMLLLGEPVQVPIFDAKFVGFLVPMVGRRQCVPGAQRLHIAVDGSVYPCAQYDIRETFRVGEVNEKHMHVDERKLRQIQSDARQAEPSRECAACAIADRCDNRCGCKNIASTGSPYTVGPALCTHERALIRIADELGERIFE